MEPAVQPSCTYTSQMETSKHNMSQQAILIYKFPEQCRDSPTFISLPEFEIHDPAECTFEGCVKTCKDGKIAFRLFCIQGHEKLPKHIKVEWNVSGVDSSNKETKSIKKTQQFDPLTPSSVESDWSDDNSVTLNNELFTTASSRLVDDVQIKWTVELTAQADVPNDLVILCNIIINGASLEAHSSTQASFEMPQSVQQDKELKDDVGGSLPDEKPLAVTHEDPEKCCQDMVIYKFPEQCRNSPMFISLPEFEIHDPVECTFEGCVKTFQDGRIAFRLFLDEYEYNKLPEDLKVEWNIFSLLDSLNTETNLMKKIQSLDQLTPSYVESDWSDNNSVIVNKEQFTPIYSGQLPDDVLIRWNVDLTFKKNGEPETDFIVLSNVMIKDVSLKAHSLSKPHTEMYQNVHQGQELTGAATALQPHKEPLQVRLGQPGKCNQEVFIYKFPELCRHSPTFISLPEFEIQDPAECTFEGCVKTSQDGGIAFRLFSVGANDMLLKGINISWIISAEDILNKEKVFFRTTQVLDQIASPYGPSEWNDENSIVLSPDLLTAQRVCLNDDIHFRWTVELTTQAAEPNDFMIVCNVSVKDVPREFTTASASSKGDIDLLLIGKTGCGKSATGNAILGRKSFKSAGSATPVTRNIQCEYAEINGRIIKVVDGPGVGDTDLTDEGALDLMINYLQQAIAASPEGYHAFCIVVRFGGRSIKGDQQIISLLKGVFGDEFVKTFCILLLTYGDNYDPEETESKDFKDWCYKQSGLFRRLVDECNGRVILFDNRTKDAAKLNDQREKLIQLIDSLNVLGLRYTYENFKSAQRNRDRLLVETKELVIREETLRETSIIIQHLGEIQLDEPQLQLKKLYDIQKRVEGLMERVKCLDKNTWALQGVLENVRNIKETVEGQINNARTAVSIQEKRGRILREMEAMKAEKKQLREQQSGEAHRELEKEVKRMKMEVEEMQK